MTPAQEKQMSIAIDDVQKAIALFKDEYRRMVRFEEETEGVECPETREECERNCARYDKLSEDLNKFHSAVLWASVRNHFH